MPGKMDRKLIELRCQVCGLLFESKNSRAKYCSDDCRKAGAAAKSREYYNKKLKSVQLKERRPRFADKSIGAVMRELAEYNHTHKKALSYGQYVARMEGR